MDRRRLTTEVLTVIDLAIDESFISGSEVALASHILVAILAEGQNQAAELLRERGLTKKFVRDYFQREKMVQVQPESATLFSSFLQCFYYLLRSFSAVKGIHSNPLVIGDIDALLNRAGCLLDEDQALSAGVVLLSMLRNPNTGVAKFFRESNIDVDELDSCLTQLEPLGLRRVSTFEKLSCLLLYGKIE